MHPVLLHLGSLEIHLYGVCVAAGFLSGIVLAQWRARQEDIDPASINDLGVWLIAAAMVGAKLFHIVFFWDDFIVGWRANPVGALRAGFVFYGGFVGATIATIVYARMRALPLWKLADILVLSVALGHSLGRLGCFFEGCCYGRACDLPWAVRFPSWHESGGIPVHPTQFYEAAGTLLLFAGLNLWYRRKRFDGQICAGYVLGYGALRFVVECFRGDHQNRWFGFLSIAQVIAIVLIVTAVVGHELGCRRRG